MITRLLLVRSGCEHCLIALKAVNFINPKLHDLKQIDVRDNREFEECGFKSHPVMDNLDPKTFDGYPYIYIDGRVIEPTDVKDLMIIAIARAVKQDLLSSIQVGNIVIERES